MSQYTRATGVGGTTITSGTLANRPTAGVADRYYWATDIYVLFRDTGTAWEIIANGIQYKFYEWDIWNDFSLTANNVINRIYYTPMQICHAMTIDRLIYVAQVAAGNARMAVYEDGGNLPDGGALVVESGSVAAVVGKNELTIDDTQLLPSLYWVALQNDAVTGTVTYRTPCAKVAVGTLFGHYLDGTAYGAFVDPCPVTSSPIAAVPSVGVRVASVP